MKEFQYIVVTWYIFMAVFVEQHWMKIKNTVENSLFDLLNSFKNINKYSKFNWKRKFLKTYTVIRWRYSILLNYAYFWKETLISYAIF